MGVNVTALAPQENSVYNIHTVRKRERELKLRQSFQIRQGFDQNFNQRYSKFLHVQAARLAKAETLNAGRFVDAPGRQ